MALDWRQLQAMTALTRRLLCIELMLHARHRVAILMTARMGTASASESASDHLTWTGQGGFTGRSSGAVPVETDGHSVKSIPADGVDATDIGGIAGHVGEDWGQIDSRLLPDLRGAL